MSSKKSFGSKAPAEVFFCDSCGTEHIKWAGRCTSCKEWNTVKQFRAGPAISSVSSIAARARTLNTGAGKGSPWLQPGRTVGLDGGANMFNFQNDSLLAMETIDIHKATQRLTLFSGELNRVLGNGLVRGSVILLAGEPGIGKSTLLLQLASTVACDKAAPSSVVYISGEENPEQIASRAHRLGLDPKNTFLICDIEVGNSIGTILSMKPPPSLVIVDSVQTMRTENCANGIGSVTQIRECAAQFVQLAKSFGCAVLLVGHVTKSGEVAGPRVLEHMVDTVLYMEGSERADYRLLRSMKNRFGSTSEVGVFTMTEAGLEDVTNPSELFMSSATVTEGVEGAAVAVIMEGSRPILAEIQCLVSASQSKVASPRRTSDGFPLQRLLLICAIIEKRLRFPLYNKDIYLNVAGGLRVNEPSADLAVAIAIMSSLSGRRVDPGVAFVGELGLSGEIRGGKRQDARSAEAFKMGFSRVVAPAGVLSSKATKARGAESSSSMKQVVYCSALHEAVSAALHIDGVGKGAARARAPFSRGPSVPREEQEQELFGGNEWLRDDFDLDFRGAAGRQGSDEPES